MDFQLWNDFEPAVLFCFFRFLPCGTGGNSNQSVDVEVSKIAIIWKTKYGYSHYIQSGFGRFFKKFSALTGTHYLYLLYMFWLIHFTSHCILATPIA
jgi:hypothetical protein